MMKNLDDITKCKIGNQILQILQKHNINAGTAIDVHIETTKAGAIKKIELVEHEKGEA